jgi:hypothetical protein
MKKAKRNISIDRKLDNIMNDIIKNKSKYIEWLIYQDLKNSDLIKKDFIL